jgi:lysophospholipase L1-like esterase
MLRRLRWLGLTLWTLLVVAVVILGTEGILIALDRGQPSFGWYQDAAGLLSTPAFVRDRKSGNDALVTDPWLVRNDNPAQHFDAHKKPGVVRIVCLGASTTVGWPGHPRASYPTWLKAFLDDAMPDRKVEVINAGFSGFDTRRIMDVGHEVLAYEPDLVILQTGFNDYTWYGYRRRGGAIAHAARALHAWLVLHSRTYNALLGVSKRPPDSPVSRALQADPAIEEGILAEYRQQLEHFVDVVSARGAKPVLMNLGYTDRFLGAQHPLIKMFGRQSPVVQQVATSKHSGFVDVSELGQDPDRLVDSMHGTFSGYAWTAHRAIQALCGQQLLPAPCQLDKLRSDDSYGEALGLHDPDFLAHYHFKLGMLYLGAGDDTRADASLTEAERVAPDPFIIYSDARQAHNPQLSARLEKIDRALGFTDRANRFAKLK